MLKEKEKTESFILELKLNTELYQVHILNKKFDIARKMYNSTLSFALMKLKLMRENKDYRDILNLWKNSNTLEGKKLYSDLLKNIRLSFCLSEYQLQTYIKSNQNSYKTYIDSNTSQKIATQVWKAISDILFKKGKKAHFKKFGQLVSVEGKSNKQGLRFKDNSLVWNKLKIPVNIRKNDSFAQESLTHRIKFCRIIKKIINGKDTFYMQLILEGVPPIKRVNSTGEVRNRLSTGRVGLDIGTSTIAVSSKTEVALIELGTTTPNIEKQLLKYKRKLDRSRRQTNPNNFNTNGTIKNGIMLDNKRIKLKWIRSKSYIKTIMIIKELYRLKANKLKMEHNKLANYILSLGDEVYVEKMNFKALTKRSKNTTINAKGKINSKKRFGKSIGNKAPAMLLTIINQKLLYQGLKLVKINTITFRASQYNHFDDTYKKKKLSQRWTFIDNNKIQRDLYSSFLLMNSNKNFTKTDRPLCITSYDNFKEKHDKLIDEIITTNVKTPSSFGIQRTA